MKKLMMIAALLAVASVAKADPSQVYGKWSVQIDQGEFASLTAAMDIQATQTVFTNTCTNYGESVSVTVTVPSQVTATQLIVTGSGKNTQSNQYVDCNIDIEPGTANYTITANGLEVVFPGAGTEDFVHAQ